MFRRGISQPVHAVQENCFPQNLVCRSDNDQVFRDIDIFYEPRSATQSQAATLPAGIAVSALMLAKFFAVAVKNPALPAEFRMACGDQLREISIGEKTEVLAIGFLLRNQ